MGQKKKSSKSTVVSTEQIQERLVLLRNLIEENETLVKSGIDINDEFLLAFLRGRKYRVEHAYETVEKFVDVRIRKYSGFFGQVQPSTMMYLLDVPRCFGLLNYKDPSTGCIITAVRAVDLNEIRNVDDLFALLSVSLEESLYIEETTRNGIIAVASGEGFGLSHMKEFTPTRIKMGVDLCLNSFPYKLKKLHVVNCSWIGHWVIGIIKPFLPRKLRNRIVIHKNLESLHDSVPREVLPNWLGGNHSEEDECEIFNCDAELRFWDRLDYYDKRSKKIGENLN